jgi:rhodanese-related sulfurtransferase
MRSFCWACVAASLLALGFACGQVSRPATKELNYEQLAKLLEKPGNVFFLDVREPAEIAHFGSVKGYVNIPLSQLEARLKEVPKNKLIVTL